MRVTTDASVSYLVEETPFALDKPVSFFFGSDEPLRSETDATAREFLEDTIAYWQDWVRSLSIPFDWQEAVIRAAITLKLCNYEETGAIVAALTTSIPEAPGTSRNWDYRFCWLRDAYFVIQALNRLGTTRTMEDYLAYIANIVDDVEALGRSEDLPPLFGITRQADLEERFAPALPGYRGMGPVRVGNAAYTQVQNDVYGSDRACGDPHLPRQAADPAWPAGSLRASGAPRQTCAACLRPAGRGTVGASHQGLRPHLLQRHVLGGLRPARARCESAGEGRSTRRSGRRRRTASVP